MTLHILQQVSKNIRDGGCCTIMADKYTDVANKEQFTICIKWVYQDLQDHEDFIGLYEVSRINARAVGIGTTYTAMAVQVFESL